MWMTTIGRPVLASLLTFALLACSDLAAPTGGPDGLADGPEAAPSPGEPDAGQPGDPAPPPAGDATTTSVTLLLTDDPTDLANAWVDIREVYLQGGDADGRLVLFEGQTGFIELLALADDVETLAAGVEIPAGSFGQLRLVIWGAAIELENGEVYVTKGVDPPAGVDEVTGELKCPSCTTSGFKVLLQGRDLSMLDPEELMVMDFSVKESFLRPAGNSGKWMMKPVVKLFDSPEDAE